MNKRSFYLSYTFPMLPSDYDNEEIVLNHSETRIGPLWEIHGWKNIKTFFTNHWVHNRKRRYICNYEIPLFRNNFTTKVATSDLYNSMLWHMLYIYIYIYYQVLYGVPAAEKGSIFFIILQYLAKVYSAHFTNPNTETPDISCFQ